MASCCARGPLIAAALLTLLSVTLTASADDFIVVTDDNAQIWVAPANGDGTFGDLVQIDDLGLRARGAAIADFDEDGQLDFVTGDGDGGTMNPRFYAGIGDGSFQPAVALDPTPGSGTYIMGTTAADFDGDGHIDFAANTHGANVGLY